MEEQFILRVPPSVAERIERLLNENASSSEDGSLDLSFSGIHLTELLYLLMSCIERSEWKRFSKFFCWIAWSVHGRWPQSEWVFIFWLSTFHCWCFRSDLILNLRLVLWWRSELLTNGNSLKFRLLITLCRDWRRIWSPVEIFICRNETEHGNQALPLYFPPFTVAAACCFCF